MNAMLRLRTLLPTVITLVLLLGTAAPGGAALVFNQPHGGGGTLHKSSWYPPDGLDGDAYCWDNFTLGSSAAVTEVRWRGGYQYHSSGSGQSPVFDFEVSIYRSIPAGTQPDLGPGGRLVHYFVGGNAGEAAAGAFGGMTMYDYAFVLPSPFQAAAATPYWVQIEAWQDLASPSWAPDWGLAVGTGGNNFHFRKITGSIYQIIAQDLTFSLTANDAATVTIAATESPAEAGSVSGAGAYPIGSLVSLMAVPNAGWGFVSWTENGLMVRNRPDYSFAASIDRVLVANFVPTYTITTACSPVYAGTTDGAGFYNSGATVTLVAHPNHGFVFTGWSDGTTSPTDVFIAEFDAQITAFFESAPDAVTYDFDQAPVHTSLPLDLTINGLTAHFTGNYSVQPANTLGFTPVGFSGLCVYPNSVFASDLVIDFSEPLKDFSVLYAVDELACDGSATMRVTAYRGAVFVATNTVVALPGVYPTATLAIAVPDGFDRAVVHWDAPGIGCQDYGPIFLADNVTVTRVAPPTGVGDFPTGVLSLSPPAPTPFERATMIGFALPSAGNVRLDVYDAAGRHVRTLARQAASAGTHQVAWDGSDDAGRRVSAGVYYLRLEAAGSYRIRRAVLMK